MVANTYLEGTYSEIYPQISQDEAGLKRLFTQFSFPGRHPEPRLARVPGLDPRGRRARLFAQSCLRRGVRQSRSDRRLRDRRRRGRDRTAGHRLAFEQVSRLRSPTGRCCRSCISTATRSPIRRCWRASRAPSCEQLLRGYGWEPYFVEGHEPERMHESMASTLDTRHRRDPQHPAATPDRAACASAPLADDRARIAQGLDRPQMRRWRSRSRAPFARIRCHCPIRAHTPSICNCSSSGCAATTPRSCSMTRGRLRRELAELAPRGERRMGANPHANGGAAVARSAHAGLSRLCSRGRRTRASPGSAIRVCSAPFLRDVIKLNCEQRQFPSVRSGRDDLERPRGGVRSDRAPVAGRHRSRTISIWHPRVASWRC